MRLDIDFCCVSHCGHGWTCISRRQQDTTDGLNKACTEGQERRWTVVLMHLNPFTPLRVQLTGSLGDCSLCQSTDIIHLPLFNLLSLLTFESSVHLSTTALCNQGLQVISNRLTLKAMLVIIINSS